MSTESEIQQAESEIASALQMRDAMGAMLAAYEARAEGDRLVFVAALIGRVVIAHARASSRATSA